MLLKLDYYYGNEAKQYSFYRIPKMLFADRRFAGVSVEAKVLYGFLLDRVGLSVKNNWLDSKGRVYIIFTIADIMETLGCAEQKANKLLGELDCAKGIGLIERKRRGLGKPNVIYVKNFVGEKRNHKSRNVNITNQEM
ncbi:MAG: replication initiator protein A [Lachnospiraceae bacterium]|nr:replication initiator protein A [Lachnospiraceae bacterium]